MLELPLTPASCPIQLAGKGGGARGAQVSDYIKRQRASRSPHTDPNLRLSITSFTALVLNSATAMPQILALSLLSLVLALCVPWTQGSDGGGQDCCLKYSQKKIPYSIVRGYRKQEPSLGCPVPAILFSPRKRSQPELCANPEESWVQKLMRRLDRPPERQSLGCRKNRGTSKAGKKGKGSKGCKGTEQKQTPRGP